MPDAVFTLDGDRVVPSELARGPWSPHHQHGGAPAALLTRAVERAEPLGAALEPLLVARLTIDLTRPVPLHPLRLETRIRRPGRKVQLVEAALLDGDTEVALCRALRLRRHDLELPAPPSAWPDGLPGPEESRAVAFSMPRVDVGFWRTMEIRVGRGDMLVPGPATLWFRFGAEVVAGEAPSPLQRVAAAADFGNGISPAFDRERLTFINADLSIHLHRAPVGEWVGLDARTYAEPHGLALAGSGLLDERGRIGRSVQMLLLDHR
jgi:hypothetical protein